jgi:hypothetical protein
LQDSLSRHVDVIFNRICVRICIYCGIPAGAAGGHPNAGQVLLQQLATLVLDYIVAAVLVVVAAARSLKLRWGSSRRH